MKKLPGLAILLTAVASAWYYQQRVEPAQQRQPATAAAPRTVSLPSEPIIGVTTRRFIYSSSAQDSVTAAGQIFTPPAEAPVLTRIGFYFLQSNRSRPQPEVSLQIILAEWQLDRPSPVELWASEIHTMPSITETDKFSWQDFDVPAIKLDANKQYIAWVTLSDLGNPPNISIGIPDMGPRYRTSPATDPTAKAIHTYAQGRAAFFREPNPGGTRQHMTAYAWETLMPGHNLFFRMLFAITP